MGISCQLDLRAARRLAGQAVIFIDNKRSEVLVVCRKNGKNLGVAFDKVCTTPLVPTASLHRCCPALSSLPTIRRNRGLRSLTEDCWW